MSKFIELRKGDKFKVNGNLFIKTSNCVSSGKPLNHRKSNAINLTNGNEMVFGNFVEVIKVKIEED